MALGISRVRVPRSRAVPCHRLGQETGVIALPSGAFADRVGERNGGHEGTQKPPAPHIFQVPATMVFVPETAAAASDESQLTASATSPNVPTLDSSRLFI